MIAKFKISFGFAALCAVLGLAAFSTPAQATSFTQCPNAAVQGGFGNTFTNVPGILDGTCGSDSAVDMGVTASTNYAKLTWDSSTAGYPTGLTFGNFGGATGLVFGLSGGEPFYELAFTDSSNSLGQAAGSDQLLFIEFQSPTVGGTAFDIDTATTQFNLYDNTTGNYIGLQSATKSIDDWLTANAVLSGLAIQEVRIGLGLSGGGSQPESAIVESLILTENDNTAVPEPGSLMLLGSGLLGLGSVLRRKLTR